METWDEDPNACIAGSGRTFPDLKGGTIMIGFDTVSVGFCKDLDDFLARSTSEPTGAFGRSPSPDPAGERSRDD